MAKVSGPLHSLDARGNLGGQVQYRGGRRGTHAYRPANPATLNQKAPSEAQTATRDAYRRALGLWRALAPSERQGYDDRATAGGEALSGWNLFLRERMSIDPPTLVQDALIFGGSPLTVTGIDRARVRGLRLDFRSLL